MQQTMPTPERNRFLDQSYFLPIGAAILVATLGIGFGIRNGIHARELETRDAANRGAMQQLQKEVSDLSERVSKLVASQEAASEETARRQAFARSNAVKKRAVKASASSRTRGKSRETKVSTQTKKSQQRKPQLAARS